MVRSTSHRLGSTANPLDGSGEREVAFTNLHNIHCVLHETI
jgi:hypothetical protein